MFDKVVIIGLGLIGGSIAKDCKNTKISKKIYAYNTSKDTLEFALKNNIIDGIYNFDEKLSDDDLVIIATPLLKYQEILTKISANLSKNTLIIDVGSVKSFIEIDVIPKFKDLENNFISCHPIAGSDKSGVQNSQNDLFKDKKLIIINDRKLDPEKFNKISLFWQKLGSKIEFLSSKEHDKAYALTSHLPQLISFKFKSDHSLKIENGSILKHLRLENSNPKMWQDIFDLNKANIDLYFAAFAENLNGFKNDLKNKNSAQIIEDLSKVDFSLTDYLKNKEGKLPNENQGFILSRILIASSFVLISDVNKYKAFAGSGFKDFTIILFYLKSLLSNKKSLQKLLDENQEILLKTLDELNN